MSVRNLRLAIIYVATLWVLGVFPAFARIVPDDPETFKRIRTLGDVISASGQHPVHIVYVHGMRAEGPGASLQFRVGLCKYVVGLCPPASSPAHFTQYLDIGKRPQATYLESKIWANDAEWNGSTPYVSRFVYVRQNKAPIIVDEVNWWPLLFPAKCRFILVSEDDLSGQDHNHLKLCAKTTAPYYPWLDEQQLGEALSHNPTSGGGARANAFVKQQIMNWGMSDAVIALGPMRTYFRRALNKAFEYASSFEAKDIDHQEYVVISESLGSFVVLDAFNNLFADSNSGESIGARTFDLYFFANQYALLQLGRIDGIPTKLAGGPGLPAPVESLQTVDLLAHWASTGRGGGKLDFAGSPKQVIAFSDPSDILTYRVPKIRDINGHDIALVVNLYDRNEWSWFGVLANPIKAHTGHSANPEVLKELFRSSTAH